MLITSPLSLCVLLASELTRGSASLFLVSTIVSKGRRVSLLILHKHCGENFKWIFLSVPSWRRGANVPANQSLEKDEECPKERLVLGDRKLALWPIVSQALLQGAQHGVWLPIH